MRQILSISVDPELKKRIQENARKYKTSKSAIVKEALRKYFTIQEFGNLRSKLMPYGKKTGFLTDEDIFQDKDIS